LKVSLFDYHFDEDLIAQRPLEERDKSRLMVVRRKEGTIEHRTFYEFTELINENFLIVVNDAKVVPARIFGKKPTGAKIEILLLRKINGKSWLCLTKPAKRVKEGDEIIFCEGTWKAKVKEKLRKGERILEFEGPRGVEGLMQAAGKVPLPPYIKRAPDEMDKKRYQTIFAKENGAVAAPTAGLHFTQRVIEKLKEKSIEIVPLTLYVGPGTFRPVKTQEIEEHKMEKEYYKIPRETAEKIKKAKKEKKKILAVGTTVTRALESSVNEKGEIEKLEGWTELFIYPGFKFKIIDTLLTNFHLPRSSLLMLVCAFGGRKLILKAYEEAVRKR